MTDTHGKAFQEIKARTGAADEDVESLLLWCEKNHESEFFPVRKWFVVSSDASGYADESYRYEHAYAYGRTRVEACVNAYRAGFRANQENWLAYRR